MRRTISLFCLLFIMVFVAFGQSNKQINALENKRKELLEKIEVTNKLLKDAKLSEKRSTREINLLLEQLKIRRELIQALDDEIGSLNNGINDKEEEIKRESAKLKTKQKQYAQSISSMSFRNKSEDKLMFILSAEDLSQTYRRIRYLREYSLSRHQQGKEIIATQNALKIAKAELESKKTEKEGLRVERQGEENKLKEAESVQKTELVAIKKKQKVLESDLKTQKEQAASFNRQIEKLIQEEVERAAALAKAEAEKAAKAEEAERAAKAAREAETAKSQTKSKDKKIAKSTKETPVVKKVAETRKADSQGGYAMTSSERELAGSFESNKGRLPFPLTGRGVITGHFGIQQNAEYKNVQTSNDGIYIETNPGTDARSVFDGTVSKVFVLPGYNTSVMVRHGKYITIYANLSQVYVKQGDKVKAKQSLGRIYTDTDDGNLTKLHFQIRKETEKLNPESWLDR